jgi:benzoylformate decarboxylase
MGGGSMHYAITALWTAAHYRIPVTIVMASNAEYGVLKEFGKWEKTACVPRLDLPGLDVVGTAASYGVDAHEAHTADEVINLVESSIADRERPTLINARTMRVDA